MNLEDVYQYYGNITKAADAVNVTRQTFHAWMRKGLIPYNQQMRYEKLSDGQLQAKRHPDSDPEKVSYIPTFRFYSDVLGMCEVHSLTYFSNRAPRIRYFDPSNRQLTFSSFDTKRLMQSTSFTDSKGIRVYEKDWLRIKGEDMIYEYDTIWNKPLPELLKLAKEVLIIGNIFEGKKNGHKRSK